MSSQAESSMAGTQGHYTNSGKSRTSFLRFHETPTREESTSLSQFSAESSPYGSEGPVTPTPRPLTRVAQAPFSSCTRPLHSDQVSLPSGNRDHSRNMLYPAAAPLPATDTNPFEIFGNFFLYTEEYHESWMEWWQATPWYIAYTAKYAGKKKIIWNSDLRGAEMWKYFQQCADCLGRGIGTPRVMCIMCRKVLAHPSGTGTSSMDDHNRSSACQKSRKFHRYKTQTGSPCSTDVLTLLQRGTKTGNRHRIINLATPAGFNQRDFKEYTLKAFLATNFAFNCSNNLAFRRVLKYLRPSIVIPCPTTLTRHLKRLRVSTIDKLEQACRQRKGFLLLPIPGLHQTNFHF